MKIKNLTNYPMSLGDGKLIGASGTNDTRVYGLDELTTRDQQRCDDGKLEVIEKKIPADDDKSGEVAKTDIAPVKQNGGKINAK